MSKQSSENKIIEPNKPRLKPFLQSFSRKKTRAFSPAQQKMMDEIYPKFRVNEAVSNLDDFIGGKDKICLEIGFGAGEHLVYQAAKNPKNLYIGAEVFLNGVAACLAEKQKQQLENIIFFDQDSRILLKYFPPQKLDEIYILFADPWPKKRHHKRRIINHQTFKLLHAVLKKDGFVRIATDHAEYFEWILDKCGAQNFFSYEVIPQPSDHLVTRYQQKGLDEGRESQFLELYKK